MGYYDEEEKEKNKLSFSGSLYHEYSEERFSEKLTAEERKLQTETVGSELYNKAKVYEQIKKGELLSRKERDVEASIRRKLPLNIKKEVKFRMLKDLSDDFKIADNMAHLEEMTKLIRTYENILKDSKDVLGEEFKDRSRLYSVAMNKDCGEEDPKVGTGELTEKLNTIKDLSAYYRVRKLIVTNPYIRATRYPQTPTTLRRARNMSFAWYQRIARII